MPHTHGATACPGYPTPTVTTFSITALRTIRQPKVLCLYSLLCVSGCSAPICGSGGIGGRGQYTQEHNSVVSLIELSQGGGSSGSNGGSSGSNGGSSGSNGGSYDDALVGQNSEPLHYLAQTNDLQELWGLGSSACAALSVLYARSALVSLLSLGTSRPDTSGIQLIEALQVLLWIGGIGGFGKICPVWKYPLAYGVYFMGYL